ncbi:unnamed protein product [Lymnaea stagnalis]|uniref:Uncharacterized protein n=1 Tax=Lymnaea stagnalis TaxID=6523 RepID=A0AAV2ILU2_LYMST
MLLHVPSYLSVADPNSVNGYGPDSDDDDDNDLLAYYKRSSADIANANLCIPWRAPCTQDQVLVDKYKFLRCCGRNSCR